MASVLCGFLPVQKILCLRVLNACNIDSISYVTTACHTSHSLADMNLMNRKANKHIMNEVRNNGSKIREK